MWWQQTSYDTEKSTVTTMSTFVTEYPNTTITNINSTVQTYTIISSEEVGLNPITLVDNGAPGPVESTFMLNGTQAITTHGVTV